MEARSRIVRFPSQALLAVAAFLVLAALAGGYLLRLTTAPASASHVTVVSSGPATSSAAQSDAPCAWIANSKGC